MEPLSAQSRFLEEVLYELIPDKGHNLWIANSFYWDACEKDHCKLNNPGDKVVFLGFLIRDNTNFEGQEVVEIEPDYSA